MTEVRITVSEEFEKGRSIRFYLRFLFHIVACGLFNFVSLYGGYLWFLLVKREDVTDERIITAKWFTPLYLTNWNFLFQTTFLTISLVYDFMEWLDRHESSLGRKLKYFRDVMFSGLVVPLTLFITTMFWTLYWIDRELVFPQVYDQLVPWWFNHCVHTNIAIVVLIETVLVARRHPTNYRMELWLTGGAGVLYAVVYYSIYFFSHRWLYGVFGIMTWWQVCLYQILIWSSTFFFYFIQYPVNRLFHREESTVQKDVQETKTGIPNDGYVEESRGIPDSWMKHRPMRQVENSSF
ncbi:hypothetical protein PYW07_011620 [Mythimna separata]|uniref:Androgen-dependent TFPI-regulating protein-like n=1 Tax=Mythimna separata TaxID=271217 RepID=A0AAD7Y6F6_MYTSE|nr:hypothetical protein PYW07_011620 [Mythimna separata]